jgi:lactoylglutathione lyase
MIEALDDAPLGSGPVTDCAVVVIGVDDVDETVDSLQGVEVVTAPTDRPGWNLRTAHIRDPDGNLVEVNAPL